MALINCRECNEQISDQAASCPKCGAQLPKTKTLNFLVKIVLIGVILITAFFALDAIFTTEEYKRAQVKFERSRDKLQDSLDRTDDLIRRIDK